MSQKSEHILNCAMTILRESGDQGLTMRKVAEAAGISLSNVQYYFKTKELLLGALLEAFLRDYAASMTSLSAVEQQGLENKLQHIMFHILTDVEQSTCAVVFKEIWAISGRNAVVKQAVDSYYSQLNAILFEGLKDIAPSNCQDQQLNIAVSILLPFIEGYCITSSNIKITKDELANQMAQVVSGLIN